MRWNTMFITAVCVIFLIKLQWPKNTSLNAVVQLCCVHCARFDILSLFFSETKCKPAKKNTGGMFYYFDEKHMQKFRYSWRKTNFTQKSHLRPPCTKPFNYLSSLVGLKPNSSYSLRSNNKYLLSNPDFTTLPTLSNRAFVEPPHQNRGIIFR